MPELPITVLMPVYNCREYVREAIESILGQTFHNFEFLIIDDGSDDGTSDIVKEYHDERIKLEKNEKNIGLIATLNKGVKLSKGKYIARMDGDDVSMPDRLKMQFEYMESNTEIGICGTWFGNFGNCQKTEVIKYALSDEEIRVTHLYQNHLCHASAIIRSDVFNRYNLQFDPGFKHAEDYEFWIRASEYCKLANIPEVLYRVRVHDKQVSEIFKELQRENSFRIIKYQFEKMGIDITSSEIDLFLEIAHSNFHPDKIYLASAEDLLLKLFSANMKSQFLPVKTLNNFISNKWFHSCYNSSVLGRWVFWKYVKSGLPKNKTTNNFIIIKFWFKAIFKV